MPTEHSAPLTVDDLIDTIEQMHRATGHIVRERVERDGLILVSKRDHEGYRIYAETLQQVYDEAGVQTLPELLDVVIAGLAYRKARHART